MAKSKAKTHQSIDNNCQISDLVQTFSDVEKGGLILILEIGEPLTCMTVPYSSFILTTTICEQTNRRNR